MIRLITARLLPALALLAALAGLSLPAHADPADIDAAARGVVRVVVAARDGGELYAVSHGSGFAVNAETIVTNAHVVGEAMGDPRLVIGIVPSEGGEAVYGRVIAISPRNDLALLRTTSPLRLAPLTLSGLTPQGAGAVTAIGYPMNVDQAQGLAMADIFRAQPPVTSQGFLSGRRPSREFDTLLHTAPIARGNSGGPLVDQCGRVIGVNSFGTESAGTEAEFFFAVSIRELLPFLRANSITPTVNSLPCRSLAELEESERALEQNRQAEAERRAQAEETALAQRRTEMRREIEYGVIDERANGLALALVLLMVGFAGAGFACDAHRRGVMQHRKIGGAIALGAVVLALVAWAMRPSFAEIEERLEEQLRAQMEAERADGDTGVIAAAASGELTCVLDVGRSRVVGEPLESLPLEWRSDGCVNGRTQYGLASGEWTRIFVPEDDQSVSINRFDPATGEYVVDRFLLDREAMIAAREARAQFQAPACGAGPEAAGAFGAQQAQIAASLPASPNERLVYRCGSGRVAAEE
ncbi:S1 family peptidase [Alteraurantiacibacter palmitatis]|uniref:Serine protease n=1 Tax=Alteraurantiacibacter palmitatis TaxID=2054628 RepID=A0ABV7E5L3_9SPHN